MGQRRFLLVFTFLISSLLASVPLVSMQKRLDAVRAAQTAEESLRFLPSGKFLSIAVLGFDNLAADLLWVRGIALFGERYQITKEIAWFDWLFQLIDVATELDPLDVRIYKYGGLMLRLEPTRIDQSTYVFSKGMGPRPDEFYLPFGVAMNYFEYKNDALRASEYMKRAAVCSNAPFYLRNLAATMMDQAQQDSAALRFLEEQLPGLKEGSLQQVAVQFRILALRHQHGARRLGQALANFLSIYRRLPQPLEELRETTLQGTWPTDPYGGRYVLDAKTGAIQSSRYREVLKEYHQKYGLGSDIDAVSELTGPSK